MRPAALTGLGRGGRGPRLRALLRVLLRLVPLAACLVPLASHAQTRRVEILNADYVEVTSDSAGVVRRLVGGVRLRQDTTRLQSDRAVYYESRGEVVLGGSVRILSGQDTLTATSVTYDSNTKTAVATGSVRLGDGESVLLAPTATYDSRAEIATFSGGGRILHRGAVLTSPRGTYSSARRVAEFSGPVTLEDSSGTLAAARGTYDADVRRADFAGDVRLRRPDAALDADSVVYFRRTERARAFGRVVLDRQGDGSAERGPEADADSSRRTLLFGETLLFDGQAETASARGEPGRDPLLLTLRADSTGRRDSTLARAPRIDATRVVAGADTSTVVVLAGGVRLWERRLAAVADSARFVRQPSGPPGVDSLGVDRLGLFGARRPSVWADGAQLTGDSLFASVRGGAVDSLRVMGRAFAARLDSTLGRLQQIAGARMLGRFDGDDLRTLGVGPNAQVVYYRASADGLLAGAEELSADTLVFRFADGELRDVAGYRGVAGTTYGPTVVPDDPRLPGFAYSRDAPRRADLLGDGWEAGWLDRDARGGPPTPSDSDAPAAVPPGTPDGEPALPASATPSDRAPTPGAVGPPPGDG